MQDLGAVASGETPSAGEMADCLAMGNLILAQWSLEELMNPVPGHSTLTLVSGTWQYTVGPSGTWVVSVKPTRIKAAKAYSGAFARGMKVSPMEQFNAEVSSPFGETASLPALLGYDNAATNINVAVFPIPNAAGFVVLDYWAMSAFTPFAALADAVSLSQGLETALRFALAIAMYPQFPRLQGEALQTLAAMAQNAKQAVMAINAAAVGVPQPPAEQQ